MKTVDARGQLCPAPLIMTKRALDETAKGDTFTLITDSRVSFANVSRYLNDNAVTFSFSENGGEWTLVVTKNTAAPAENSAAAYCPDNDIPHLKKGDFTVAISSDRMGSGDPELGTLLMANFIKAIRDLDTLPSKMVFYNRGIFMAAKSSPVYGLLNDLEKMGVSLYLCGTCINHYRLAAETDTGTVSNMFEIAQIMASSGKVIRP
ncbi:MAG: sulfurtransferase-like selenium metabolism protein YedF [Bacteroidales bacterium]|jgi:selenium metabolism protein YedF|nr:sulfurtransferase-like selenium metabolism protein YedF [Bacteroidales bacterium]